MYPFDKGLSLEELQANINRQAQSHAIDGKTDMRPSEYTVKNPRTTREVSELNSKDNPLRENDMLQANQQHPEQNGLRVYKRMVNSVDAMTPEQQQQMLRTELGQYNPLNRLKQEVNKYDQVREFRQKTAKLRQMAQAYNPERKLHEETAQLRKATDPYNPVHKMHQATAKYHQKMHQFKRIITGQAAYDKAKASAENSATGAELRMLQAAQMKPGPGKTLDG